MIGFFKVFGKGVLYTILLPFILLIWALFTVYCVCLFIFEFFKSVVVWISGGSPFGDTKEDVKAKQILLERQNKEANAQNQEQYKDAIIATLASAVAQQAGINQQAPVNPQPNPSYDVFPTQQIEENKPSQLETFIDQKEEE